MHIRSMSIEELMEYLQDDQQPDEPGTSESTHVDLEATLSYILNRAIHAQNWELAFQVTTFAFARSLKLPVGNNNELCPANLRF